MIKTTFKRMWLIMAFCLFSIVSSAQLSVQINGLSPYQFKVTDAWNLIITNSSEIEYSAELRATIQNSNGLVAEIISTPTQLKAGVNIISSVNVRTASLKYSNNSLKEIELQTGSLPPGNYSICIEIKCINSRCYLESKSGASDNSSQLCFNHKVESPSPLLLSYPAHLDTIKVTTPVLIWIPPMPIGGQPGISYSLNMVKKENGQSLTDAMNRNRKILSIEGINSNTQPYPISIPELETNSTYVWQVKAFLDNQFITASEIWEFSLKEEIKNDTIKYFVMDGRKNSMVQTSQGKLYLKYRETYSDGVPLKYRILNSKNQEVFCVVKKIDKMTGEQVEANINMGINQLLFDFNNSGLPKGEYYIEITNLKKEIIRVKVIYN